MHDRDVAGNTGQGWRSDAGVVWAVKGSTSGQTKIGRNVRIARHALAIDELRKDFVPTIWVPRENLDLRQVWFAGAHSHIGGGYPPDSIVRKNQGQA